MTERRNSVEVVTGGWKWDKTKLIFPLYRKWGTSDNKFRADNTKCTSCGICAKSCPVDNITMVEGLPQWQHNCTMCLSCIHRCPTVAIQYGKETIKKGRYYFKEKK